MHSRDFLFVKMAIGWPVTGQGHLPATMTDQPIRFPLIGGVN
jgi:hypothetical protein